MCGRWSHSGQVGLHLLRGTTIRIWHTSGQAAVRRNLECSRSLCFLSGVSRWRTVGGSRDHTVTRWDLATGVHAVVHRGDGAVLGLPANNSGCWYMMQQACFSILASDGARLSSQSQPDMAVVDGLRVANTKWSAAMKGVLRLCGLAHRTG